LTKQLAAEALENLRSLHTVALGAEHSLLHNK
jgi:hypothetical protein